MSDSRIPHSPDDFNKYITTTDDYQKIGGPPTNAIRLGLTATNSTDWTTKRTAWDLLFKQYVDPALSTSVVKDNVRIFIKSFHTFGNPLLNVIAASPNANATDAAKFNVVIERARPTHHTEPIAERCFATAQTLGGGEMKISCRTDHDASRASKADHADSEQIAWIIADAPPANVNDVANKEIITKASFTLHLGAENAGRKLFFFSRWYNTKHPELAGPWSDLNTAVIS
jgi:phosphomannomutase